ncbi:hypothetical protein DH2020_022007 [Rehmannia glutinosa]|uniref:Uncharacterized protein n=1 Tax=Rehmannia glutinosa TaxID=99300 RepID=A0ABR0WC28_REHGL
MAASANPSSGVIATPVTAIIAGRVTAAVRGMRMAPAAYQRRRIRWWVPLRRLSATIRVCHLIGHPRNSPCSKNCWEIKSSNGSDLMSLEIRVEKKLRSNQGLSIPTDGARSLHRYASETTVVRYAKTAQALRDKTVRDVALRCRWMNKKENGKRRKDENNARKNKDKKESAGIFPSAEKVTDSMPKSSQVANRTNGPPFVQSMMSIESDDGISFKGHLGLDIYTSEEESDFEQLPEVCAILLCSSPESLRAHFCHGWLDASVRSIGGAAGQLLEQNAQALEQISANFSACKIHENVNLFCQARNNISSILNDLSDMPEIMKQMPPLPVKLNEELANSILPRPFLPKKSSDPHSLARS